MKSQRSLLAALGCCLLLGSAMWFRSQTEAAPPPPIVEPPPAPSSARSDHAGGDHGSMPTDASAPVAAGAGDTDRVAAPRPPAERPVALHVVVLTDEPQPQPLAGVEVEVEVEVDVAGNIALEREAAPDSAPERFTAVTDVEGRARLDLGRRSGREARIRTGVSAGSRSLRLEANAEPTTIVLRMPCRALVTGSVVDGTGAGIADADLLLLPWGDPDAPPPPARRVGRSSTDGSFRVMLATGGRLGAQHARLGPSAMYPVKAAARADAATNTHLQLVLRASTAVWSGRVVDVAGQPVARAKLHAFCTNPSPPGAEQPAPPHSYTTADDGSFAIGQLLTGTLRYEVRAPRHGLLRGQLTLVAGTNPRVELVLPPACSLSGVATDPYGEPVPAARIVANDASGRIASTRTGVDGSYRLDGLPPGRLALVAQARAGDRTELLDAAEVELAPTLAPTWNPHLQPVAADRQLRSRLVDHRGRALAGYELVARGRGQLAAVARTAADGSFTIGAPGPGLIDLRAFAPGRSTNQFADAVWRQLDPATPPPQLRLEPVTFGTLIGRVETARGQPQPAKLGIWHETRGEYVEYQSALDGTFRLAGVAPGRVRVTAEAVGLPTCHRHDVNVLAGSLVELPPIVMAAGARVTIVVTDPSGAPATGCTLRLLGAGGSLSPTADGGTHRFAAVPAGEWVLQVSGPGFAAVAKTLVLQAGEELQQAVRLEVGSLRRVLVAAPPDAGDRVTLQVRPPGQASAFQATAPVVRANPTATGTVVFEVWMAPGRHDVTAVGDRGWAGRDTVVFGAASGDVTIPLRAAR